MGFRDKLAQFNWGTGSFLIAYHACLAVGLPIYLAHNRPHWGVVVSAVVLFFGTSLGITAGYHRLFAHKAYEAHPIVRLGMMGLGTLALQGSVLEWAADHRVHHKHVDTDKDPYTITKGFFFAHMGWLLQKSAPSDLSMVPDLTKDPILRFQHRHFVLLSIIGNALVTLLVGLLFRDLLGAFVIAWWTRLLVSHHFTWFINSLAHTWGARSYSREHSAVDNFLIALVTVGEGYHNYHHTFASDYRNGVRWYHFDPSKWTIWTLARVGLATNLKRYDHWMIQRRLVQEDRRQLLARIRTNLRQSMQEGREALEQRRQAFEHQRRQAVEQRRQALEQSRQALEQRRQAMEKHCKALELRVQELSDQMVARLQSIQQAKARLRELRGRSRKVERQAVRTSLAEMKRRLREDRRNWQQLYRTVQAQLAPKTA